MKKIFFLLLLLSSLGSGAQVTLGMSPVSPLFYQDTVSNGQHDSIAVFVKNYGPGVFDGMLGVRYGIDSAGIPLPVGISPFAHKVINAGDSTLIFYTTDYNVAPGSYQYGIDVIVVWPVSTGTAISVLDSLFFDVYINEFAGIHELDLQSLIRLYPNPGSDRITIENKEGAAVKTVVIYDISGREIRRYADTGCIDIQDLAPGIYHAEVTLSDKKHCFIKFMRQ